MLRSAERNQKRELLLSKSQPNPVREKGLGEATCPAARGHYAAGLNKTCLIVWYLSRGCRNFGCFTRDIHRDPGRGLCCPASVPVTTALAAGCDAAALAAGWDTGLPPPERVIDSTAFASSGEYFTSNPASRHLWHLPKLYGRWQTGHCVAVLVITFPIAGYGDGLAGGYMGLLPAAGSAAGVAAEAAGRHCWGLYVRVCGSQRTSLSVSMARTTVLCVVGLVFRLCVGRLIT